jgi:hypothetical protein
MSDFKSYSKAEVIMHLQGFGFNEATIAGVISTLHTKQGWFTVTRIGGKEGVCRYTLRKGIKMPTDKKKAGRPELCGPPLPPAGWTERIFSPLIQDVPLLTLDIKIKNVAFTEEEARSFAIELRNMGFGQGNFSNMTNNSHLSKMVVKVKGLELTPVEADKIATVLIGAGLTGHFEPPRYGYGFPDIPSRRY